MRYILCQDIRYTLPPRICGKGGPRPALPAAAPMLACVAAGDRSPAHTCAGSLPAVVPPLPPRERVVRPVLHTRTRSRLPSSASPSRSALAPCSPTDIPTPAPGPDSSANSRDNVLQVSSSATLREAFARCRSAEILPAPQATPPVAWVSRDSGWLRSECDEIAPPSPASADDAPAHSATESLARSIAPTPTSAHIRSWCPTTHCRGPSTSLPARRSVRKYVSRRDKSPPQYKRADRTAPRHSDDDRPESTACNSFNTLRDTLPSRPLAT